MNRYKKCTCILHRERDKPIRQGESRIGKNVQPESQTD